MATGVQTLKNIVSDNKVLDHRLLNILGAQVLRTLTARLIYNLRSVLVPESLRNGVDELAREGILVLHDFLPTDHFELMQQECRRLLAEKPDNLPNLTYGSNTLERSKISCLRQSELPNIYQFMANRTMHAILEAAEKRSLDPYILSGRPEVQRLTQNTMAHSEDDPETRLHSDIFFNTHKAWLYLTDVDIKDGPHVYVKRSHRLSLIQLCYIYAESCGRNMGSRRISPDELERMGLKETIITCPKNTLVIANTCGYHRRLTGQLGGTREAIHIHLRANPFTYQAEKYALALSAMTPVLVAAA